MQIDEKAVLLPCRFGASNPQAIGVTCQLPLPFGLYLLLDGWCILGDKHCGHIEYMNSESVRIPNRCVKRMRVFFP